MPRAISTNSSTNVTSGIAVLGERHNRLGTIDELVHDGDTVAVRSGGNFGVRLLGIDTPEVSFSLPEASFVKLTDERWQRMLADPFDPQWGPMPRLPEGMVASLKARTGPDAAADHFEHAERARPAFAREIKADQRIMGSGEKFEFFLVFGFEVMDKYGRFLCLLNRNQPDRRVPTRRPPTYNLRLLQQGLAFPYFIWPNINPWEKADSIMDAVFAPGTAASSMTTNGEVDLTRQAVRHARSRHLGLFDAMRPMLLEPFELRMLARRGGPSRYLIDLTRDDDVLLHPNNYWTVPHPEDRLWIPKIYVPLFVENGWKKQPDPMA